MKELSVLLVIHNEEKQIESCIKTVLFADEIVVVLDKCNDNSHKIVKKYTNQIFSGDWDIESERRNYGLDKCSGKWILEIDADERISEELGIEIQKKIKSINYDWFNIRVNNYIGKNLVKFGWGAYIGKSAYAGLFRKGFKEWGRGRVHPKIYLKGEKGDALDHPLDHFYCKNIYDLFVKLDSYSNSRAKDLLEMEVNETLWRNVRRIFSRFWKSYVLRRGYKEKKTGFVIALVASLYPLISYMKYKFTSYD